MNSISVLSTAALLVVSATTLAEGSSPWLPFPGQLAVSIGFADQTGDSAYIGSNELSIRDITGGAAEEFERDATTAAISYGISDNLAFDAAITYATVEAGRADKDSAFGDSQFGLSWRITDEFIHTQLPTITVRTAAILKGNYDGARLVSIGKDANALEVALIAGKSITPWLGLSAQIGSQYYEGDVPDHTFYEVKAHITPAPGWSLGLAYSENEADTNLDIGGPGFTPARFQEVAEERSVVKLSAGYGFGNQGIALNYSQLIDGRNTVDDDSLGLSYTFAF